MIKNFTKTTKKMGKAKKRGRPASTFPENFIDYLQKYLEAKKFKTLKGHLDIGGFRYITILRNPEFMNVNELRALCRVLEIPPSDLYIHYSVGKEIISVEQMTALTAEMEELYGN